MPKPKGKPRLRAAKRIGDAVINIGPELFPRKPRCKCGRVCAYYGSVGGYSVKCAECNARSAAGQRRRRREGKPKAKPRRVVPSIGRGPFDFVTVWLLAASGRLDLGTAYAYMDPKNWEKSKP